MPKTLDKFIEKCGASHLLINKNRRLRRQIFFDWRRFLCYLLTVAVMQTTKTLLLLIFINIILTLMFLLVQPGISLNVFGTLIYLKLILFWLINIPNSDLLQELHPACSVPIFYQSILKLLPELENTKFHLDDQPYASLFKIYKKEFLDSSVDKGLIHKNALALAGISCTCDNPCSDAKHGRTVHLVMNDNPRLFNNPPRSSKEWKLEYNARTSAERSNKREKLDFKLEDGRHRSTKMWYCRLYHILMLQHLDTWDLPSESPLKKMILDVA